MNISILSNVMYKLPIFLHKFDNVRNIYHNDSVTYAHLGNIKDNFLTLMNTLYRDMTVPKPKVSLSNI